MGDRGREESVYMQNCRKEDRVRVYIDVHIWDERRYMAHTTDLNGECVLCLSSSRRRRLKHRGTFISMYSGSARLSPWRPLGSSDFSSTLGEPQISLPGRVCQRF